MAQYIDKSVLVAEIERRRESNAKEKFFGRLVEDNYFLDFIDTLEVKGVDLDSNIRTYLTNHFNIYEDGVLQSKKSGLPLSTYDIIKVAKHFFELGLQVAQKGE